MSCLPAWRGSHLPHPWIVRYSYFAYQQYVLFTFRVPGCRSIRSMNLMATKSPSTSLKYWPVTYLDDTLPASLDGNLFSPSCLVGDVFTSRVPRWRLVTSRVHRWRLVHLPRVSMETCSPPTCLDGNLFTSHVPLWRLVHLPCTSMETGSLHVCLDVDLYTSQVAG